MSIVKMGVLVKFHFASRFEIDVCKLSLNLIFAKTKYPNFLQQESKYKKISEQLADKLIQSKILAFNNKIVDTVCLDLPNAFWHRKKHIVSLPYVKDFSEKMIATKAQPIQMNAKLLDFCQKEIADLLSKGIIHVCLDLPNAFWHRKKHIVSLPYVKDFSEKRIPTKAQPIQMNVELLYFCQKEIADLLSKGIIRKSKSPWSCATFYVRKMPR